MWLLANGYIREIEPAFDWAGRHQQRLEMRVVAGGRA